MHTLIITILLCSLHAQRQIEVLLFCKSKGQFQLKRIQHFIRRLDPSFPIQQCRVLCSTSINLRVSWLNRCEVLNYTTIVHITENYVLRTNWEAQGVKHSFAGMRIPSRSIRQTDAQWCTKNLNWVTDWNCTPQWSIQLSTSPWKSGLRHTSILRLDQ